MLKKLSNYKEKILLFFITLTLPLISCAQGKPLVPCDGPDCDFNSVVELIQRGIDFILTYAILPIAAVMFAYAGYILLFQGDNPGERTKAMNIFKNVAIGVVVVMAAWLIVHTILSSLIKEELLKDYSLLGLTMEIGNKII